MRGFKLLAIRPLEGCDPNFLKNLKEGMPYKFYQDIVLKVEKDGYRIELTTSNFQDFKSIPIVEVVSNNNDLDLYSKKGGPNINISAIVGENGSGKSALTELFLKAMFDLSVENRFISKEKLQLQFQREREFIEKQRDVIINSISNFPDSSNILQSDNKLNFVLENGVKLSQYETKLNSWDNDLSRLDDYGKSELYFEIIGQFEENKPFIIRKNKEDKKIKITGVELRDAYYSYQSLFYTIFLNYSIYGLNTSDIGDWIDYLYHKNDGYQTPVVINPQKTDGNIDVNREEELSRYRINRSAILYGNVIDQKIEKIYFELKEKKHNYSFNYDWDNDTLFINNRPDIPKYKLDLGEKTETQFLEKIIGSKISDPDEDLSHAIVKYFLGKLFKTDYLYNLDIFTFDQVTKRYKLTQLHEFCSNKIEVNTSHKFLKLKQVIDLVKSKYELCKKIYAYSKEMNWVNFNDFKTDLIEQEDLDLRISFTSIFNVDYMFSDNSTYSKFSSGQKQLVNTLETINYHIRNVVSNKEYKSINIVLDEVELYFHPEFQRELIKKMIISFNALNLNSDYSINVLFLTHSPFILSDIPSSNILRLKAGEPSNVEFGQTFSANILDMFLSNFFMSSTIGAFAEEKIKEIIKFQNEVIKSENKEQIEGLKKLYLEEKKDKFHEVVKLIGDDVINGILENNLIRIEEKLGVGNFVDYRIKALQEEIKRLTKKQ